MLLENVDVIVGVFVFASVAVLGTLVAEGQTLAATAILGCMAFWAYGASPLEPLAAVLGAPGGRSPRPRPERPEAETEAKATTEPEAKSKVTTEAKAETEAKAKAETEAKAKATTDAKTESKTEANTETETETKTKADDESDEEEPEAPPEDPGPRPERKPFDATPWYVSGFRSIDDALTQRGRPPNQHAARHSKDAAGVVARRNRFYDDLYDVGPPQPHGWVELQSVPGVAA